MAKRKPSRNVPPVPVLSRLRKVSDQRDQLRQRQLDLITEAREAGHTWTEIGPALSTTPEAARKLYIRHTGIGPTPRPRKAPGTGPSRGDSFYRNVRRLAEKRARRLDLDDNVRLLQP